MVELLSRIQFAVTAGFHFLYPPMSIGLGLVLVIIAYYHNKTKSGLYEQILRFWTKVFGLTFAVGVSTGIVMEFEFGTNWATYSRYVGDIFGSPLAAEALFAFFMESIFLGILLFGFNKVSPKVHFISTIMVALGATLSAFWIIVANSWMHTPAGYQFDAVNNRVIITDFWEMVFNPSTLDRYFHVLIGAWLCGAFLVLSISAHYIIKQKYVDFARTSFKIALCVAVIAAILQLGSGHYSAVGIAKNQPAKLAAFEGHYDTTNTPAPMYLFGWVDNDNQKVYGVKIPNMLSLLVHFDASKPVTGLNHFPQEHRPPVNGIFQTYHIMIALGILMILMTVVSVFFLWKKNLFEKKWLMKIWVPAFVLPHIALQTGWISTEIGRQPWVVQGILMTKDAYSKILEPGQVWLSLIMFTSVYLILGAIFVFLLVKKIKHGPEEIINNQ